MLKWHLRCDDYFVGTVKAETAYKAAMHGRERSVRDLSAEQPEPERYPALWRVHFTRPDAEGVRRNYYTDLWVYPESAGMDW